jgi:hypothetical protein
MATDGVKIIDGDTARHLLGYYGLIRQWSNY